MKTLLLVLMLAVSTAVSPAVKPEVSGTEKLDLTKRADGIIFPKIDYREASVPEIVEHLNRASKDLDPDKVGVPIELSAAAKANKTKITISLSKVPLTEVIKYITNLASLKYRITSSKVMIATFDEK
jgi:hypothetical protein